jgi:hypothetical protein
MTNNKQQTAVDLYRIKINSLTMDLFNRKISGEQFLTLEREYFERAKEMEKERMIGFTNKYINSELWVNCNAIESDSTVEQYYQQTYGGGEQ